MLQSPLSLWERVRVRGVLLFDHGALMTREGFCYRRCHFFCRFGVSDVQNDRIVVIVFLGFAEYCDRHVNGCGDVVFGNFDEFFQFL